MLHIEDDISKEKDKIITRRDECEKVEFAYITQLLRSWLLPHIDDNPRNKAFFIGYMVKESLDVYFGDKKTTDRDNLMYKCIDMSGFLISAIFRDLYFRLKNDFIERCNMNAKKESRHHRNLMQFLSI